ncbi:MAG: ABC transporter substrate-binding protein [Chloroflexota bacterium]
MKYRNFSVLILLTLLLMSVVPLSAQDDVIECEEGFRLFDHELLATEPVCIPEDPERIVTVWTFNLTALLRADASLVASLDQEFNVSQFPNWEVELSELPEIGRPPNFELMLSLAPDLIIVSELFVEDIELYTSIAPTVVFQRVGTHTWREEAEVMFDALGELTAYEALMTELDNRIAELGDLLVDATEQELSIVNLRPDRFRLYTQYFPGGIIIDELGFDRPEVQLLPVTPEVFNDDTEAYPPFSNPYVRDISLEVIDEAEGDFILVFGSFDSNEEAQAYLDEVMANPLWQALNAVQEDNVYISNVNFAGGDIGNVHAMLDELAEAFGVADEFSENPYEIKAPIPELDMGMEATEEASAVMCEDGFRSFESAIGSVCVPDVPQRIVATHDFNAGVQVLSLGGPLVGIPSRFGELAPDITQFFDLDNIQTVGQYYEPNIETILQLEPDLIVHEGFN